MTVAQLCSVFNGLAALNSEILEFLTSTLPFFVVALRTTQPRPLPKCLMRRSCPPLEGEQGRRNVPERAGAGPDVPLQGLVLQDPCNRILSNLEFRQDPPRQPTGRVPSFHREHSRGS